MWLASVVETWNMCGYNIFKYRAKMAIKTKTKRTPIKTSKTGTLDIRSPLTLLLVFVYRISASSLVQGIPQI